MHSVSEFFPTSIKFFFILTPFFALSVFIVMTRAAVHSARTALALRVGAAVILTCFILFFFGNYIFSIFGITLDSFRIGAGAILFLSAIDLVRGVKSGQAVGDEGDIAVVPLAIPVIVGPGTTGVLLVMGAETEELHMRLLGCASLFLAVSCLTILLLLASTVERLIGQRGLSILSKITGLVIAALASQMVFTGIHNILS